MIAVVLDYLISAVRPDWGLQRLQARATMTQVQNLVGSGTGTGYAAGKVNRLTAAQASAQSNENAMDRGNIARMRAASYQLYRDNPQCRKICRSLESKIIGRGLRPQSQAVKPDGTPHVEFRKRAHALWAAMQDKLDSRGAPGRGGQSFPQVCKTALRGNILGGEVLIRFLPGEEDPKTKLPSLKIRLIHADRLSSQPAGEIPKSHSFFHGIEFDADENRVAYHISRFHPSDPRGQGSNDVARIPASEIVHLYIPEDIDQIRGAPWLSASLLKMRDVSDYEYTELVAAKVAACVVFSYKRSLGQSQLGVNVADSSDLTDANGNKLTAVQPGMIVDKGQTGELDMHNPARPSSSAGEFIQHMLRSQATGVAGIKSSSLTGDYRGASFSSEKAADNDTWPEIQDLQDWLAAGMCQTTYEQVVTLGVASGYFQGVIDAETFKAHKHELLPCNWQGPVSQSINPEKDAAAAKGRVQTATSTPQIEAAKTGTNWQENVIATAEFIAFCVEQKVPQSVIDQWLGIEQKDVEAEGEEEETPAPKRLAA